MKNLVRTVPIPVGDDSGVHEDIMNLDIQIPIDTHIKIEVCMGCYKKKHLKGKNLCKKFQEKIDKEIPFKILNRV